MLIKSFKPAALHFQILMRYVGGVKVKVFGDSIDMTEGSIMIMNHRTRLDWLYIWDCLLRFGPLNKQKVVLKSELKNIPGPGEFFLWKNGNLQTTITIYYIFSALIVFKKINKDQFVRKSLGHIGFVFDICWKLKPNVEGMYLCLSRPPLLLAIILFV